MKSKRLDWMYDDPVAKQEMKNKKGGEDAFEGTDSKAQGVPSDKEEIEQFCWERSRSVSLHQNKDSKRHGAYNGRTRSCVCWLVAESRPWG